MFKQIFSSVAQRKPKVCNKFVLFNGYIESQDITIKTGAQWLSGRVLDLKLRGNGFEPHRRHCVVSLSKTHLSLLSRGSTQEFHPDITEKIVDWE